MFIFNVSPRNVPLKVFTGFGTLIGTFLNEGKESYLSQNKNSNQNFNHQKNKRDSSNNKNLVDNNREKSSIDKVSNSNHNIDVNA